MCKVTKYNANIYAKSHPRRCKSGETCNFQMMSSYSEGDARKLNNEIDNITVTRLTSEIVKLKEENEFKVDNIGKVTFKELKYLRK